LTAKLFALWLAVARKIWVMVKPQAKHENVVESDGELLVSVNAPASEGKANIRLIELLAEYFHTAKSNIRILRGQKSRRKLIEID
jgi:uncharacterized protein (TIGR00251 family)